MGAAPSPRTPLGSPVSPCHLHPRWTLRCRSAGFLVIIPHALQPCLLRTGCQAAAWPVVAVAELDKAPASLMESTPPPRRPKWREGRQLPRPRPLFVWRGGGELCLAPGAAGLCQSLPRLSLPGPRTLCALSAMLGDARSRRRAAARASGRRGQEYNSGALANSPGPHPTQHRVRDVTGTELESPAASPRLQDSEAPSCCLIPATQTGNFPHLSSLPCPRPHPSTWKSRV